jgi:hypothetical protein
MGELSDRSVLCVFSGAEAARGGKVAIMNIAL